MPREIESACFLPSAEAEIREETQMDNQTLILILVILLVLGVFGGVGRRRWW